MKKVSKIILPVLLIISIFAFIALATFGFYKMVVTMNQTEYKETPLISKIEERSEIYILGHWFKSGVELEFITQELIGENISVYYFKVVEPEYFYASGVKTCYVKAVYKFQYTGILFSKSWLFDTVLTSSYEEIQAIFEVEDEKEIIRRK